MKVRNGEGDPGLFAGSPGGYRIISVAIIDLGVYQSGCFVVLIQVTRFDFKSMDSSLKVFIRDTHFNHTEHE